MRSVRAASELRVARYLSGADHLHGVGHVVTVGVALLILDSFRQHHADRPAMTPNR